MTFHWHQGDSTAHVRMDTINKDTLKHYFCLLNEVVTEFNPHSTPSQMHNVYEREVQYEPHLPSVIIMKKIQKLFP